MNIILFAAPVCRARRSRGMPADPGVQVVKDVGRRDRVQIPNARNRAPQFVDFRPSNRNYQASRHASLPGVASRNEGAPTNTSHMDFDARRKACPG